MANDNTVNVEITASVDGLNKGLKQADSSIKGFGTSTDKVVSKTNNFSKSVKVNAVPAMTSFSQVVQDAPYGIRGVANNITQLTSQFGYLSKSAGGAGNAFKVMLGTLTGPAGILLAVSLVTSLLVSYGDELANIGSEAGKAAEKQKQLAESLESTSSVLSAQVSALESQIKLLKAQGIPVKELLNDKLKLLEADLASTVQQRAALVNQLEFLKAKSTELSLAEKILNVYNLTRGLGITQFAGIDDEEQKAIDEIEKSISNTTKSISELSLAIGEIRAPEIFNSDTKSKVKVDPATISQPFVEAINASIPVVNEAADGFLETWKNKLGYGIGTAKNTLEPLSVGIKDTLLNSIPTGEEINEKSQAFLDSLNAFNEQSAQIIQGGLANTFAGIGEGIGEALANGGNVLQSAGAGLLSGLGSIMVDLGKQAILTGITIEAVKKALQSLNGPVAIAAGVALVAAGSLFKSTASNLGSSMGGGTTTDYSSGSNSSSYGSSSSYSSGGSGGTYVFEIAGTKLIGVLKNTLDRNKSLGGSTNLLFS